LLGKGPARTARCAKKRLIRLPCSVLDERTKGGQDLSQNGRSKKPTHGEPSKEAARRPKSRDIATPARGHARKKRDNKYNWERPRAKKRRQSKSEEVMSGWEDNPTRETWEGSTSTGVSVDRNSLGRNDNDQLGESARSADFNRRDSESSL